MDNYDRIAEVEKRLGIELGYPEQINKIINEAVNEAVNEAITGVFNEVDKIVILGLLIQGTDFETDSYIDKEKYLALKKTLLEGLK